LGKERENFTLFEKEIIPYLEIPEKSTEKPLKLVTEFQ
jgi:hypothetical protein